MTPHRLIHPPPNHIFIVTPINERIDPASSVPPKQPAAFNAGTKEKIRRFGKHLGGFAGASLGEQLALMRGDSHPVTRGKLIHPDILSE